MLNYFKILEIPDFSNESIIKRAYRNLSKKYHPDVNNDPAASDYFITINSAYEFLMDENKRLLLNQFLQANDYNNFQKATTQNPSENTNTRTEHSPNTRQDYNRNNQPLPIVHNFSCDRSHYTLGDHILISWSVSQCKSVRVSILGNVDFVGSEYFRIDTFSERLKITLRIVGLDDKEYVSEMILYYQEENLYKKAYHEVLNHYPNANPKHFVKESLFNTHGRLGKKEFTYRMILFVSILIFLSVCYYNLNGKLVLFILLVAFLWTIYQQLKKRTQDVKSYKDFAKKVVLPVWNISYLKGLFTMQSEPNSNEYGVLPETNDINILHWILSYKNKFTWFHGLKIASSLTFLFIMIGLLVKVNADYEEVPIDLKRSYITSSGKKGNSIYMLLFEYDLRAEILFSEFEAITRNKDSFLFKAGLNDRNEVQYVKAINHKINEEFVFRFGVLSNANPILIFIVLLFIAQLFAMISLKKQEELIYAKGILLFILFLNIFIIMLM